MTDDQRQQLAAIIDAHDKALAALRASKIRQLESQLALTVIFREQDAAIGAAIDANRAALALLRSLA